MDTNTKNSGAPGRGQPLSPHGGSTAPNAVATSTEAADKDCPGIDSRPGVPNHPDVPGSDRFQVDCRAGHLCQAGERVQDVRPYMDRHDWFLCGDGTWRAIDALKTHDTVTQPDLDASKIGHGTHYAADCAAVARAAFLDAAAEVRKAVVLARAKSLYKKADKFAACQQACIDKAAVWAAWGKKGTP